MDRNDVDWRGYWVATTTPFKKDGSLDEEALRKGMRSYPSMGITGVLVNGTSGEWFSQTDAERRLVAEIAVDELPVLFTHALRSLALGGVFLAFNLRSEPWQDVRRFIRDRSPALRFVAMNELVFASIGLGLALWALSLGPAALVTALSGTRAFFLVLYSTILALVWKGALGEITTRGAIATKIGSTALIVGGVAVIAAGGTT